MNPLRRALAATVDLITRPRAIPELAAPPEITGWTPTTSLLDAGDDTLLVTQGRWDGDRFQTIGMATYIRKTGTR